MKVFYGSLLVTLFAALAAFLWAGSKGLTIALILCILEISLSFDNAVVNASVLKTMEAKWQKRFLIWGILIAVFLIRFILPILIVDIMAHLSFSEVLILAFKNPEEYAKHLKEAHLPISAFGGTFLLMVFLSFLFDFRRDVYWIKIIDGYSKMLPKIIPNSKMGPRVWKFLIEIIITLSLLFLISSFLESMHQKDVLFAGIFGIILYSALNSLIVFLEKQDALANNPLANNPLANKPLANKPLANKPLANKNLVQGGAIRFLYLEVLDASFSLDGVIAAFAITKDVVIIMLGLAIGAMFVRSITIFLIKKQTLEKYLYLEHGAHYAIGAIAFLMLSSILFPIPEILTGLVGVIIIGLSLISSIRHNRRS